MNNAKDFKNYLFESNRKKKTTINVDTYLSQVLYVTGSAAIGPFGRKRFENGQYIYFVRNRHF